MRRSRAIAVGVLGLAALCLLGAPWALTAADEQIADAAASRLATEPLPELEVTSEGRSVSVAGILPVGVERSDVADALRDVDGIRALNLDALEPSAPPPAVAEPAATPVPTATAEPAATATPAPTEAPTVAPTPVDVSVSFVDGSITLEGTVPSQELADLLGDAAAVSGSVENRLVAAGTPARTDAEVRVEALGSLFRAGIAFLDPGNLTLVGDTLTISGQTPDDISRQRMAAAVSTASGPLVVVDELTVRADG